MVHSVELEQVTLAAGSQPKSKLVLALNPLPVTVMVIPPASERRCSG